RAIEVPPGKANSGDLLAATPEVLEERAELVELDLQRGVYLSWARQSCCAVDGVVVYECASTGETPDDDNRIAVQGYPQVGRAEDNVRNGERAHDALLSDNSVCDEEIRITIGDVFKLPEQGIE